MSSDVDEYLKAITACKGVDKIVIMAGDGFPIKSSTTEDISNLTYTFWHLSKKVQQLIKTIENTDEVRLVRYRSKKNEILMAIDNQYVMIVIQNPKVE